MYQSNTTTLNTYTTHFRSNSAAATVTITVNGVNDAPVSGGPAMASGTEDDASIGGSVPAATDVDVEQLGCSLVGGRVKEAGVVAAAGLVRKGCEGKDTFKP